jgi:poly(A) polymerase
MTELLLRKLRSLPAEAILKAAGPAMVYVVGGPIRDSCLAREYSDIDLAVEGRGAQVARRFASASGGRFVMLDEEHDESRVVLKDHTFDFSGFPEGGLKSDLERRDFTINSIAVDLRELLEGEAVPVDPFDGLKDIDRRVLKATTERSFGDDPVRILRAFRFSAQLGFRIEDETLALAREKRSLLGKSARERIAYEILLTFSQPQAYHALSLMADSSVLCTVFPMLEKTKGVAQNKLYPLDVFSHSLKTYEEMEKMLADVEESPFAPRHSLVEEYLAGSGRRTAILKMAALLHDIAKPDTIQPGDDNRLHFYGHDRTGAEEAARFALEELKMSKKDSRMLLVLVKNHMWPHLLATQEEITERACRKFYREMEIEGVGVLLLAWADSLASVGPVDSSEPLAGCIDRLLEFYVLRREEVVLPPLINGRDLIEKLGLAPGPLFGKILREVEKRREEGLLSTRDDALRLAEEIARKDR